MTAMEIILDDRELIKKKYKLRRIGQNRESIQVTVPKEVFERDVRRLGLDLAKAVECLDAVWRYNAFPGLHLCFEQKKKINLRRQSPDVD